MLVRIEKKKSLTKRNKTKQKKEGESLSQEPTTKMKKLVLRNKITFSFLIQEIYIMEQKKKKKKMKLRLFSAWAVRSRSAEKFILSN